MSKRMVLLNLTPREPAVFSERAATEGAHRTLSCPTGSALLGWAAARLYSDFNDPFSIFHSGKVRFSNAYPLVGDKIAWPVPRLLMEKKHERGGIENESRLKANQLVVGRPRERPDGGAEDAPQYQALKGYFVSADGEVIKPQFSGRLRTATEDGRAKKGQLFGFQHIDPGKIRCYRAMIEADDGAIDDAEWTKLLDAFNGKTLRLGRGSGTAYGGYYECQMTENAADPWPQTGSIHASIPVRVWALSDIALVDRFGAPCFSPTAEMFGLPKASKFLGDDSAISVRRFAPWNAHLNRRDIERQVIEAGSVLSFKIDAEHSIQTLANIFGLWREAGLGHAWIAPPMLSVQRGKRPIISVALSEPTGHATAESAETTMGAPEHELIAWTRAMALAANNKANAI